MKNLVRIGVIGAGSIANRIHLPVLKSLEQAQMIAICDPVPGRAQGAAERFGIAAHHLSHRQMLQEETLDAVFVLTQPDSLYRPVYDSLSAGMHVFMEKPMGLTLFQAQSLAELAREKKRNLHVGFNRRYIPLVREVHRIMSDLTQITCVDGCFFKNSSPSFYQGCGDAFVCDVIHVVDLVRHLSGGQAVEATLRESAQPGCSRAGAWYGTVAFDNGAVGVVRASYAAGARVHRFDLHGPGASAFIDLGFGDAGCTAKIVHATGGGSHSMAAAGSPGHQITQLDGRKLAGDHRYERYYGYYDEDLLFVRSVLEAPEGDPARTAEDIRTMELLELMLAARHNH